MDGVIAGGPASLSYVNPCFFYVNIAMNSSSSMDGEAISEPSIESQADVSTPLQIARRSYGIIWGWAIQKSTDPAFGFVAKKKIGGSKVNVPPDEHRKPWLLCTFFWFDQLIFIHPDLPWQRGIGRQSVDLWLVTVICRLPIPFPVITFWE